MSLVAGRPAAGWSTGASWLGRLPRLVGECLDQWGLSIDGSARHGRCALVLPVRRDDGVAAVLKVSWPHPEAEHEHLALSRWAGRGAVLLLTADPGPRALLLERLAADHDLTDEPIEQACGTIGSLLRALDRPALPALWNRWDEVVASDDIRAHLRWRLELLCAATGVDAERARVFVLVREVENALRAAENSDRRRVSQAVTTVKAMSD